MPPPDSAAHRRSYRSLLALVAGSVVLLVGGALGTLQYRQSALARNEAITVELEQASARVNARIDQLLHAAELTATSGARRTANRTVRGDDLLPLFTEVLSAFEQRPEMTYLGYTIVESGEYALLERRPDSTIFLRLYRGPPGPARRVLDHRWTDGRFALVAQTQGDTYDPRTRPHFLGAINAQRAQWTEIYPFVRRFPGDVRNGTTYALPTFDATGALSGMWDASFDLLALSEFVRQLQRETGASAYLYGRRGTALTPLVDTSWTVFGDSARFDATAPPPTLIDSLLAVRANTTRVDRATPARLTDAAGQGQFVVASAIADASRPQWTVAVTLPQAKVDEPLQALTTRLLLATAGILALALLLSTIAARWLAQPIEELGEAADAISRGAALPLATSAKATREIASLRGSFSRMSSAIATREQELRDTAQRLQSHFDNTPLGVIEFDERFVVRSWNPAAEAIFGWSSAEMIGHDAYRIVPESERTALFEACKGIIVSGRSGQFHFDHITRTGIPLACDWYATPTKDDAGHVTGVSALVLDVSQRMGAEDAFRQAEDRFERLFMALPVPCGITRLRDSVMLQINDAALALFKHRREELVGKDGMAASLWNDQAERIQALARIRRNESASGAIARMRSRDGNISTVLYSAVPVTFNNEPCGIWVAVDITERERMQQQLRESQALKTAIVDAANDAIVAFDDGRHIVEWNDSATRLLGWERDAVIGRTIYDIVDRNTAPRWDPFAPRDAGTSTASLGQTREMLMQRRDGTTVPVELTIVATSTEGRPIYTVAMRDISVRQQLARQQADQQEQLERRVRERTEELASANVRLREVDGLKNQFLAMVSHELRTPLTGILGYVDLLKAPDGETLSPTQQNHVTQLHTAASDLLRLINDLLDLSRVESGRLAVRREPVAVTDVLRAVEALLAPDVQRKGLAYRTEIDPSRGASVILSDRQRIQQVILNLASNAVKFTRQGSVSVRCEQAAGGGVTITVTDTGPGIDEQHARDVFQPFTSYDPEASQLAPGTGLGLYLVKRLLEMLGGRVEFTSRIGEGTRFTVWLPAATPVTAGDASLSGQGAWVS
jgi:PAS domain S-box-containing protein